MDPAQMMQDQQLQQLQLQLRQLELQLQLHQQQLQEPWTSQQQQQSVTQQPNAQQQESQPSQQPSSAQQDQQSMQTQQPEPKQQDSQQQGSEQQQQQAGEEKQMPLYFTPPKMVSIQDIGYIKNMLSSNILAVKQYRQAAQNCQLPDLKIQFKEAGQMHLGHVNGLVDFLNENGGMASGSVQ